MLGHVPGPFAWNALALCRHVAPSITFIMFQLMCCLLSDYSIFDTISLTPSDCQLCECC